MTETETFKFLQSQFQYSDDVDVCAQLPTIASSNTGFG
jgi:hypothetical protein